MTPTTSLAQQRMAASPLLKGDKRSNMATAEAADPLLEILHGLELSVLTSSALTFVAGALGLATSGGMISGDARASGISLSLDLSIFTCKNSALTGFK